MGLKDNLKKCWNEHKMETIVYGTIAIGATVGAILLKRPVNKNAVTIEIPKIQSTNLNVLKVPESLEGVVTAIKGTNGWLDVWIEPIKVEDLGEFSTKLLDIEGVHPDRKIAGVLTLLSESDLKYFEN